jgi:antitoxin VapB
VPKTQKRSAPLTAKEPGLIEREVSLFRNGANQALRIPKDLELPGDKALIRQEGGCLVIRPAKKISLTELIDQWEPLAEQDSFPDIEDMPAEPVKL